MLSRQQLNNRNLLTIISSEGVLMPFHYRDAINNALNVSKYDNLN